MEALLVGKAADYLTNHVGELTAPAAPVFGAATRKWRVPVRCKTAKGFLPVGEILFDETGNLVTVPDREQMLRVLKMQLARHRFSDLAKRMIWKSKACRSWRFRLSRPEKLWDTNSLSRRGQPAHEPAARRARADRCGHVHGQRQGRAAVGRPPQEANSGGAGQFPAGHQPIEIPWHHLRALLLEIGRVEPIRGYDESYLSIRTPDVLAQIQSGDAAWEEMVPAAVAEIIKAENLFGWSPQRVTDGLRRPSQASV